MQVTQCLHTAVLVADLERAEHFYTTVLGLSKVERPLKYPGMWYQIGAFQLHLIVDPAFEATQQNSEKWGRNRHLAFGVTNLKAARERLCSHGYDVQMSASGRTALFTQDPDGNVVEISEV